MPPNTISLINNKNQSNKATKISIKEIYSSFILFIACLYSLHAFSYAPDYFDSPPFTTNHWRKLTTFQDMPADKKLEELNDILVSHLNKSSKDKTVKHHSDALQYYLEKHHKTFDEKHWEAITLCYGRLLSCQKKDDTKHTIIDCLAAFELLPMLEPAQFEVLGAIQSKWRQYLFQAIGLKAVQKYHDDTIDSEIGWLKKELEPKKDLQFIASHVISESFYNTLQKTNQKKIAPYLKLTNKDFPGAFSQLQEKYTTETDLVFNKLTPEIKSLYTDHSPLFFSSRPSRAMVIWLTSIEGKVDCSVNPMRIKDQIDATLSYTSDLFSADDLSKWASDATAHIVTAMLCMRQHPFTHKMEELLPYLITTAFITPTLETAIEHTKDQLPNFRIEGYKKLREHLSRLKHKNIAWQTALQKDQEVLIAASGVCTHLKSIRKYCNGGTGSRSIVLSATPNDLHLPETPEEILSTIKKLHKHLKNQFMSFTCKTNAHREVQEALEKGVPEQGQITQETADFVKATLYTRRCEAKPPKKTDDYRRALATPKFRSYLSPFANGAQRISDKATFFADPHILEWSLGTIHNFKQNNWRLLCSHYRHSKWVDSGYIDPTSITRELKTRRPIEVIPETDAFIDQAVTVRDYTNLMLVALQETRLKLESTSGQGIVSIAELCLKQAEEVIAICNHFIKTHDFDLLDQIPTPRLFIENILEQSTIDDETREQFIKQLDKSICNGRNALAKLLKHNKYHALTMEHIGSDLCSTIEVQDPEFSQFYHYFQKALISCYESQAYKTRAKQTPLFVNCSIEVCCLPQLTISSKATSDNSQDTSVVIEPHKDIVHRLTQDLVNSTAAQIARNLTSGDSPENKPLLEKDELKLLESAPQYAENEKIKAAMAKLKTHLSNEADRKKYLEELIELSNKWGATTPMGCIASFFKHVIPAAFNMTYNIVDSGSTYLNAAIIAVIVMKGLAQLQQGLFFDQLDGITQTLMSIFGGLQTLVSSAPAGEFRANLANETQRLNDLGQTVKGYYHYKLGSEAEHLRTVGANEAGWVPENVFTTIYVSAIGILSVVKGVILQCQTLDKLSESEQLSLLHGEVTTIDIEKLLTKNASPSRKPLYTPTFGEQLEDFGSYVFNFNAHFKNGMRSFLKWATGGRVTAEGTGARVSMSVLSYLFAPLNIILTTFSQNVPTRIHTYEDLQAFSKDAKIDRMVYSVIKLAGFDVIKPFIDTRIPDTTNLMTGIGILAADFPVATFAKSSLCKSVQTDLQLSAALAAIKELWEENGASLTTASIRELHRLYGSQEDGFLDTLGHEERELEEPSPGYDDKRRRWLAGFGLITKLGHLANYGYNVSTYIAKPAIEVGRVVRDGSITMIEKVQSSLGYQPGPHTAYDFSVHAFNTYRKAEDKYFFGFLSPISVKFLSTGLGKVLDNFSVTLNVHAAMASHYRRGTNYVALVDTISGSFKDAITGAFNRLAIASGNKPLQTFAGGIDTADTPLKELFTSWAQHLDLTMLPPAILHFAYHAARKAIISALQASSPLQTALNDQLTPLATATTSLGMNGLMAATQVINSAVRPAINKHLTPEETITHDTRVNFDNTTKQSHVELEKSTASSEQTTSDQTAQTSAFIKDVKQSLSDATGGFMAKDSPYSISQSEPVDLSLTDDEQRSYAMLDCCLTAIDKLVKSHHKKGLKRYQIAQIMTLIGKESPHYLQYLRRQQPIRAIRHENFRQPVLAY